MRTIRQQYRIHFFSATFFFKATAIFVAVVFVFFGQGAISQFAVNSGEKSLFSFFSSTVPLAKPFLLRDSYDKKPLLPRLLGFDIENPLTIIKSQIAVVSAAEHFLEVEEVEILESRTKNKPKLPENAKPIEEITVNPENNKAYINAKDIYIKNNTTYTFDTEALLNEPLTFDLKEKGPKILIVHTHASESFTPSDKNYYVPSDPSRTQDLNFNITRVGREMADVLNFMGIETIHDQTLHDYPSYNSSYSNTLKTVEEYLKKFPSLKIVIDVHRDAIMGKNDEKLKVCTNIDGEKVAQVMVLTGTDQGGLNHPFWKENLKFALLVQSKISSMYPTLARPLNLTKERYNTHTTKASFILEVGSNGNTLEEAISGGKLAARAIGELVNSL